MTRTEGRWGTREKAVRVCLLLCLSLPAFVSSANGWRIGGRLGLELEGLDESQQTQTLFSGPSNSGAGDVSQALDNPILSRRATPQGLIEVKGETGGLGRPWLRLTDTARLASSRSRNSFAAEGGLKGAADRLRFESRWDVQGGSDEPAAGSSAALTTTWDHDSLPLGIESQIRLGTDWSRTTNRDLAGIFDFRTFRGHLQLRRDLGPRIDLRALGGYRRKDSFGGSRIGSYDSGIGEIEADGDVREHDHIDAVARIEDRTYKKNHAGIPSSIQTNLSARYDLHASRVFRPYVEQGIELEDYRTESGIFQDHQSWTTEAGTDLFVRRLQAEEGSIEAELAPDWRLRFGGKSEIFRASAEDADSIAFLPAFNSLGVVTGIAREGGDSFWCDLTFEAGRRLYRSHSSTQQLVFEGLNLSLASSDYTYLSASVMAQWTPVPWIRAEAFVQWDDERHDRPQDNYRLWIANVSLTYPF